MVEANGDERDEIRQVHQALISEAEDHWNTIDAVHRRLQQQFQDAQGDRPGHFRRVRQLREAADRLYQSIWYALASALYSQSGGVNATATVTDVCYSLVLVLRQLRDEVLRLTGGAPNARARS